MTSIAPTVENEENLVQDDSEVRVEDIDVDNFPAEPSFELDVEPTKR
jgi:hypothetical protein